MIEAGREATGGPYPRLVEEHGTMPPQYGDWDDEEEDEEWDEEEEKEWDEEEEDEEEESED